MASLYCARCRLRTKLTEATLLLENCPRCLARSGTVAPLVVTRPVKAEGPEAVPEPEPTPSRSARS